jgi:hypothetical protein
LQAAVDEHGQSPYSWLRAALSTRVNQENRGDRHARYDPPAMIDQEIPLSEQLEGIKAQLDWVSDYL